MTVRGCTTIKAQAQTAQEGDYLPGLDNGYVYEDASGDNVPGYYDGRFVTARSGDTVSVCFHTAEGEEGELLVPGSMPLTIDCPGGHDHEDVDADADED